MTFSKFALIVCLLCALMIIATYKLFAQAQIGFHFDYAEKCHLGAGIEGGDWLGNSYLGINTLVYFTRRRDIPASVNLQYGYKVNKLTPFVIAGIYTCGAEAVNEGEGSRGIEYGGGLSYQFNNSPIKLSIQTSNVKTNFSFALVRGF